MVKNWICTICQRFGDEIGQSEAEQAHRNLLLKTAQDNAEMTRIHGWSFVGPSSVCEGKIVLARTETRVRGPKPECADLPFDE